jgi:hypothetical protein
MLLPLRPFDQRYALTRGLAERVCDAREEERVRHSMLSSFRQRLYQIIAGYEDTNDADRLVHDPVFQILAAGEGTVLLKVKGLVFLDWSSLRCSELVAMEWREFGADQNSF